MVVFPQSAQPRTIYQEGGTGATLGYELPAGVILKLESVVAEISTVAAAPNPVLLIRSPEGVIIAAKRQTDEATVGGIVTATWALRLPDDGAGSAGSATLGASVRRTADFSVPNGVTSQITFTDELWDTDGMASLGVNNDRLTVRTAGVYMVTANFVWASGDAANNTRAVLLSINGASSGGVGQEYGGISSPIFNASGPYQSPGMIWAFSVGDFIGVRAFHFSPAAKGVRGRLTAVRLGASP